MLVRHVVCIKSNKGNVRSNEAVRSQTLHIEHIITHNKIAQTRTFKVHTKLPRNILDCVDGLIGIPIGLVDFLVRVMSWVYFIISYLTLCSVCGKWKRRGLKKA